MSRPFRVAMMAGGALGVALYVYAETADLHGGWKAAALVLAASGLDTFWDLVWTWLEKRHGEID